MASQWHRNWTAQIVVASEHAGLKPYFRALECELYRVLARVDDPREVREYLAYLGCASRDWLIAYDQVKGSLEKGSEAHAARPADRSAGPPSRK